MPEPMGAPLFDNADEASLELRAYFAVARRRRWIIIVTFVVILGGGVVLSLIQTPIYDAETSLLIQQRPTVQALTGGDSGFDPARNVDTEVQVIESKSVEDAAIQELGHEPDIKVESDADTDVVKVVASSTTPRRAARDANAYANAYIEFRRTTSIDELLEAGRLVQSRIDDVDDQLASQSTGAADRTSLENQRVFLTGQLDQLQVAASLQQAGVATILAQADVPDDPARPRTPRYAVIAATLGLLLGLGLAFLIDHLDDRIRSGEALEHATDGLPVLGEIPLVTGWRRREQPQVVSINDPRSAPAEAYQTLRTSVQFLGVDRELRTLQITSAVAGEGKTTTIANLAVSFARAGLSVVVVCCDLRRPRVHEFFGLDNSIGFTSILLGQTTIHKSLQLAPAEPQLAILASGPPPPNPSELLSSAKATEIVQTLAAARDVDIVLLDSPPVLPVSDALIISRMADTTLLVASAGRSSRRAVRRAMETLQRVDAPLVGTVFNGVSEQMGGYGGGMYSYTSTTEASNSRG